MQLVISYIATAKLGYKAPLLLDLVFIWLEYYFLY